MFKFKLKFINNIMFNGNKNISENYTLQIFKTINRFYKKKIILLFVFIFSYSFLIFKYNINKNNSFYFNFETRIRYAIKKNLNFFKMQFIDFKKELNKIKQIQKIFTINNKILFFYRWKLNNKFL